MIQHYAWGGHQFIPDLLHFTNDEKLPFAEYWMGAHDNAPAKVILDNTETKRLNRLIGEDPFYAMGPRVADRFGRLPYLLKVLDVKDMLSIQVHPDKESAQICFEEENKRGIPLDAPDRNYKDANHKPELMVALSDFWLLHGFKQKDALLAMLGRTSELSSFIPVFESTGYKGLYKFIMEMPQAEVNSLLRPLLDRILVFYNENKLPKSNEDFWAARASLTFQQGTSIDRGIFSIYLFNLVNCKPGEAVFQDAGVPHAYLEGQNVEIMANSDNVLRGGLTPKHIDVVELMKHIKFEGIVPAIISGKKRDDYETVYETPAPDFELSHLSLPRGKVAQFRTSTADILFVEAGQISLIEDDSSLNLSKGEAAVMFSDAAVRLVAAEDSSIFRASVP